MAERVALHLLEIWLALTLQKILTQRELSDQEKAQRCDTAIEACLENSQKEGKRLFFDPSKKTRWDDLCHSVAIEELHNCYFKRCNLQKKMGHREKGALFVVYDRKGMGKSYACRCSLLVIKHSRGTETWVLFFGGQCVL
jgi:hypothetical protein